ncbi:MAG: hypothetical protein M3O09_10885 [Acidobacteriota bacterium]|nr:hypothetical protein [Acidobacteriota bacterium]
MIVFSRNESGTYTQSGEVTTSTGKLEWLVDDGKWDGGWRIEPVAALIERMNAGPYKYLQYRILEAEKPTLDIKSTCAGCGANAGTDCQRACEYIFGKASVTESLLIQLNDDHQFALSIVVAVNGKNFGNKKPKTFVFNSVRCAELFLMQHGYCKDLKAAIGSGERLLAFMDGAAKKPSQSRRSLEYKQAQMLKRVEQSEARA